MASRTMSASDFEEAILRLTRDVAFLGGIKQRLNLSGILCERPEIVETINGLISQGQLRVVSHGDDNFAVQITPAGEQRLNPPKA